MTKLNGEFLKTIKLNLTVNNTIYLPKLIRESVGASIGDSITADVYDSEFGLILFLRRKAKPLEDD